MQVGTSRVTSKGQLTIPQEIRDKKGFSKGTVVLVVDTEEGILIKKASDLKELFEPFRTMAKKEKRSPGKLAKEITVEKNRTLKRLEQLKP